ncbi:unnamed protein product, partial [Laminaria digitata]
KRLLRRCCRWFTLPQATTNKRHCSSFNQVRIIRTRYLFFYYYWKYCPSRILGNFPPTTLVWLHTSLVSYPVRSTTHAKYCQKYTLYPPSTPCYIPVVVFSVSAENAMSHSCGRCFRSLPCRR